ncbi:MAG: calcium/sodium antiporter [Candidatus Omnitrophota bacterium]
MLQNNLLGSALVLVCGLVVLVVSARWFIQGCVRACGIFRLTPLFIGLVLVAAGTSVPELAVGLTAVLKGQRGIALGNVLGSNVCNIGLILGLCAFFRPLSVDRGIFKREAPALILSLVLFYLLGRDLVIGRIDGALFILAFVVFCFVSYFGSRRSFDSAGTEEVRLSEWLQRLRTWPLVMLVILPSLAGVGLGAELMVRGGVSLARAFGVRPWIIAITVFALGTSLPELATSLTASFKKASDISVGNIIGSNIFNVLLVLGLVAVVRPITVEPSVLRFEFPFLFLLTVFLTALMRRRYRLGRREGLAMLLLYIGFLLTLVR